MANMGQAGRPAHVPEEAWSTSNGGVGARSWEHFSRKLTAHSAILPPPGIRELTALCTEPALQPSPLGPAPATGSPQAVPKRSRPTAPQSHGFLRGAVSAAFTDPWSPPEAMQRGEGELESNDLRQQQFLARFRAQHLRLGAECGNTRADS